MNHYGSKELAASFRTVRNNTIVAAEEIPEDKYSFRATPETRRIAQMLVHISLGTKFPYQIHGVEQRTTMEGFDFPAFFESIVAEEQKEHSKAQILAMLREEGDNFASWLEGLSDDFLSQSVHFPAGMTPPFKSRLEMLLAVKEHEMHHRAQVMLLQRMVGVVPHLTRQMEVRIAAMMKAREESKTAKV